MPHSPGLTVGLVGDPLEHEADRIADLATRAESCADGPATGPAKPIPLSGSARSPRSEAGAVVPAVVQEALSAPGRPLDRATRDFFEPRLGRELRDVRVVTDAKAASAVSASAYTLGTKIVFNAGQYQPSTASGRRLIAHELAHVLQQQATSGTAATIQRSCTDPDFCTPYATPAEAASARASLISFYLPADFAAFGSESTSLYISFLSRHPGDSLAPVVFDNPASALVSSFADSGDTKDDIDAIIDLVGARLSLAPGPLTDNTPTIMSVENFLSRAELDNRPINYSNPFSIAGHIAGGIGSSDAGPDYRRAFGNVTLERVPLFGSAGYVKADTHLTYEVFDAVDFCPGDYGSPAEQRVTVPMSRLEAGGAAYDVPFKVTFTPESRTKRFFY